MIYTVRKEGESNEKLVLRYKKLFFQSRIVTKLKNNDFLDVIPSGTIPPNPSELLMSKRVGELFDYIENRGLRNQIKF